MKVFPPLTELYFKENEYGSRDSKISSKKIV